MTFRGRLFVPLLVWAFALSAYGAGVSFTIDTESATALLSAIQNRNLTRGEAMSVAQLGGNQGAIRKLNEFMIPATTESLANAVYAAAHGETVTRAAESSFYLEGVKARAPQLLSLIRRIEADPRNFQAAIEHRVGSFTPPGGDLVLHGYVVAAGDGGGYAFGGTEFYLNVGIIDELVVARNVANHELYHAVQGAFAEAREQSANPRTQASVPPACAALQRLFAKLYEEGSATEVEDVTLLSQARSAIGIKKLSSLREGLSHLNRSSTLLEMSVAALSAEPAVPFDDVYRVGFYGDGILYDIGYVMAKAIAESDGPQGLARFLTQPAYRFILRYTQLPKYGTEEFPRLGPNTVAAANRMASECH